MTGPGDVVAALLGARSTRVLDEDDDGRLLLHTDVTGTGQLRELDGDGIRLLTAFREPVTGHYLPGSRWLVVSMDAGGDERGQLRLANADDPPGDDLDRLTPLAVDPAHLHRFAGATRGGRVAYVSNARNGVDVDVWVVDVALPGGGQAGGGVGGVPAVGEARCVHDGGGWWGPGGGFSPDGRWLAVLRPSAEAPMSTDLRVVDVVTGEAREVLAHPGEAAAVGAAAWLGPTTFLASSNAGREFRAIVWCDLTTGEERVVLEADDDLDVWASDGGGTVLVVANAGGSSRGHVLAATPDGGLTPVAELELPSPDAVVAHASTLPPPVVAGRRVTLSVTAPDVPGDVWRFDAASGALTRLTTTPLEAAAAWTASRPGRHVVTSFDGEPVPVFLHLPTAPLPGAAPLPCVVFVHGGPESQSHTAFQPVVQALAASGYAVVVPNVRGSTGYGRRWYGLDDTTRRLDSVADLAAIHDWLPSVGLDPARAALWGASYGGYMVLAGCAFQPERWAAGVDVVGISDLLTFLRGTAPYRRAVREAEYGSPERDAAFLAAASPLRRAADIVAPLFVVHGANDPRVPLAEAEQLAAALRARDVRCELLVYPDEGHGLSRQANRLDAYPRAIGFLDEVLQPRGAGVTR